MRTYQLMEAEPRTEAALIESAKAREQAADSSLLVIKALVYAEVWISFDSIESLEAALPIVEVRQR